MELATVFLVHTLKTFGKPGARLGFVMPRSVLSADQHAKLRERTYVAPAKVTTYWDLWDVEPLFNVPASVLFAVRESVNHTTSYSLPCVIWSGRLPRRDVSWSEAQDVLTAEENTARLVYLASRSALSTAPGVTKPYRGSSYRSRFRQGATIVPRNFYFVRIPDTPEEIDQDAVYSVETDPEQANLAKPPYRGRTLNGRIEGQFLFLTALSRNLLPFTLVDHPLIVLPAVIKAGNLILVEPEELRREGFRHAAAWFTKAAKLWTELRERKAARQSLLERLDYQRELTGQRVTQRHLVLYNAAGTNLCAARVDRKSLAVPFVVEHKLYWAACETAAEADYLAAVLNAPIINEAIKPFQSTGLMGERDIEKKVLDLRIPAFNSERKAHRRIAELGAQARSASQEIVSFGNFPERLARRRAFVRAEMQTLIDEINGHVFKIL
jgi:hypothetical protein